MSNWSSSFVRASLSQRRICLAIIVACAASLFGCIGKKAIAWIWGG